ncbi:4a-hydroxytetrahydrobiopterin dehydratase [Paenarthrobacter nitroguajacolicus]|uniref:4a-hydroxytetrahydrobiopterin dehydratase n=1 Tax=Paenarthrobacter nitroguajacolicus TaxID=211146 RepID=UPI00248C6379|nr:4a-hydroxytetrahydrobiopterin dehydratase [Paenarthrobacter nitroguajacolicus]MDI2035436.1 putative pterin-4-alpha-carbinolamine dehydratase [Paenarthrobacter nitroguajacolicus]
MAGTDGPVPDAAVEAALRDLPGWKLRDGLVTVYKCSTAANALALIAEIGRIAEEQNHHPDLQWRYNRVFLRYVSHDAGGELTQRDLDAAASVSEAASALGAVAEPGRYPGAEGS